MADAALTTLREATRGRVLEPDDVGYDEARAVFNGMHDRRPRAIVQCVDAADVQAGLRAAESLGLRIAVKGGGHSVPGFGVIDDGLVIDLSPMSNVRVDPSTRTARAGGGATWGDFDHATHGYGLATPGGIISTTGVGGLTLGGGIGYLARRHGLSCDNLISADVVTADGAVLTASERQHEDLFWALRGGGGNFGVVTSLEFELHPVSQIVGGPTFFEIEDAAAVMAFYRDLIREAPEELGMFFAFQIAPPLPFIPEDRHGDTLCALVTCWSGEPADLDRILKPMYDVAPVVAQHLDPMPYPALNGAFDPLIPPGMQHYWKAQMVATLTDEAIAAHVEHGSKVPTVQSTMHLYPLNGAVQRVGANETAFPWRDVSFAAVIAGMWPDPADNTANTAWVRDYYAAIAPHGSEGAYVNFMGDDDGAKVAANYGPNYERLRAVKAIYDPTNTFNHNQNITPAG